jgi:hypothetical protein
MRRCGDLLPDNRQNVLALRDVALNRAERYVEPRRQVAR